MTRQGSPLEMREGWYLCLCSTGRKGLPTWFTSSCTHHSFLSYWTYLVAYSHTTLRKASTTPCVKWPLPNDWPNWWNVGHMQTANHRMGMSGAAPRSCWSIQKPTVDFCFAKSIKEPFFPNWGRNPNTATKYMIICVPLANWIDLGSALAASPRWCSPKSAQAAPWHLD